MDHPVYKNMHSYPWERDQIYYSPHFYPETQPTQAQMYINPHQPHINYGFVPQSPCHGSCNHHTCMPAQYPNWGFPYSHQIPPTPHCPIRYPLFPAQYMPCCPVGHQYEFEKNVPTARGQHCCGCPNHIEPGNVKIEEEPGSMAPLLLKNGHSPIVLMPPDNYNKMKEQCKDNDNINSNNQMVWKDDVKNGWYPLDLNNLVSMKKETGDGERTHQRNNDGDESDGQRFPFPFFRIPHKSEENKMEMEKHNKGDLNTKLILKPEMSSPAEEKTWVKEESSKNQDREIDDSVKDSIIDPAEKKLPKESAKRKNPSKSSKLPPVCLRVDPLPRRKTAKGSLRSDEAKNKVTNSLDDKVVCDIVPTNGVKEGMPGKVTTNEVKEGKPGKVTKTIKVVDGKTLQEKNMDVNVEACVNQQELKLKEENSTREFVENDAMKGRRTEEVSAIMINEEKTNETSKRKLSEEEAAVIIQSVYRGFDTRRWNPVQKLKEIAKVRDQIDSVKHMIQTMESCSAIEGISKQRNVISETIMSLLLKLDTIQGLYPSIREVRKSVAKELVSLQEKLDSIMIENLSNSPQQESNVGCEEDASVKIEDATLSENVNEVLSDLSEVDQNQPTGAFITGNSETLEENKVLMDKLDREDEKTNEGLKSDDISVQENLILEGSFKAPNLPDSSMKGVDSAQSKPDELYSELAELPRAGLDDLCAQEKETHQKEEGIVIEEAPVTLKEERIVIEEAPVTLKSQNLQKDYLVEADIKTGHGDKFEHEECIEIKSDMEVNDANKSFNSEKAIDTPLEKEMSGDHLLHDGNLERDMVEKTDTAVKEPANDTTEENAIEHEKIDVRNRKLVEENNRLRGIMENLAKLGQEQLTAISSLTVRVQDLERRLSKKKKLKVKQSKNRKMRGLVYD